MRLFFVTISRVKKNTKISNKKKNKLIPFQSRFNFLTEKIGKE